MLAGGSRGEGYMSARYEAWREEFDLTLREWLLGGIRGQNSYQESAQENGIAEEEDMKMVTSVSEKLRLGDLLEQSVMTLSNGQSRRARIAQVLLKKPQVLIVDEPFSRVSPLYDFVG
jgi:ABC-type Mn2+/Zn2+ transport system ATPase subunit